MILLFAGARYYPNGGADDYVGAFGTLDEAAAALVLLRAPYRSGSQFHDWANALDTETGVVVAGWTAEEDTQGHPPPGSEKEQRAPDPDSRSRYWWRLPATPATELRA
jgi:hypothetical protein